MQICVLDVETTFQIDEKGKKDPSPYNPKNYLVSVGTYTMHPNQNKCFTEYLCFQHNEEPTSPGAQNFTQQMLDHPDLLVWHNGKFDRAWLLACGFKVPFTCWDTMIAEYVLSCGLKDRISLKESCIRKGVQQKKTDLVQEYLDKGIGFEAMPWEIVQEYGIGDLVSTAELFWKQLELLGVKDVREIIPSITPNN